MTLYAETGNRRGWYYGWNIVAVCILAQIAAHALPINAYPLFLPSWSSELGTPISTLQLGFGAFAVISNLLGAVVGHLADKYSARSVFGTGLVGAALLCFGVSFVKASWQLLAFYALLFPLVLPLSSLIPSNAVVSRWFVRRLGVALGFTNFGIGIAGVFLPPIISAVMAEIGWRTIWQLGALVVAVVITPIVVWVLRDRPTEREGLHYMTGEGGSPVRRGQGAVPNAGGLAWRDVFARRTFWLLVVAYLSMVASTSACYLNLSSIAASHGFDRRVTGSLLSGFNLALLLSTLTMGVLSDRVGNRRPLAGLAFVTAIGILIIAFGGTVPTLGAGMVLIGVAGGLWPLVSAAIAAEFGASGFGRAFGLMMSFMPLGMLSPFLVAKVQESTGSYTPALCALSALTVAGGVAALALHEIRPRQGTDAQEAGV